MNTAITIALSLVFSAFFSGMELAFVSANRLKIELQNKRGAFTAKVLAPLFNNPKKFIAAMLVGNNIALVIYGFAAGEVLTDALKSLLSLSDNSVWMLLLQTLISTLVLLVTAEFLPKAIFRINANWWLELFSVPLFLVYIILYVPAWIVSGLSRIFLKVFLRVDTENERVAFGQVDLDHYIREYSDSITDEDEFVHRIQIMQNALDFSNVKARDCLVPRNELVAVDLETEIAEITKMFVETRLSKILVYRDSIDNIIGYVHSKELFKKPTEIKKILLPVSIVPEPMPANEVLGILIAKNRNMAVVVDEFGGTSGIVTMEDVVEEIFGEINDEHDLENQVETELEENRWIFSGRLEINYINEKYNVGIIKEDEFDTLAGFILHHHEDIPKKNEIIKVGNHLISVKKASNTRIEEVEIKRLDN